MTKNLTQVLAQSISIIKEIPIPHALLIAICILIIWAVSYTHLTLPTNREV